MLRFAQYRGINATQPIACSHLILIRYTVVALWIEQIQRRKGKFLTLLNLKVIPLELSRNTNVLLRVGVKVLRIAA